MRFIGGCFQIPAVTFPQNTLKLVLTCPIHCRNLVLSDSRENDARHRALDID